MDNLRGSSDGFSGENIVEAFLPEDYLYKLISCEIVETDSLPFLDINFDLEVRVNVTSEDEVTKFLQKLNMSSSCTFNIMSGRPDKKPDGPKARSKLRGYRKCCLNVKTLKGAKPQQAGKDTNCSACIQFRLETPRSESEKQLDDKKSFPLWLKIHYNHNHTLNRAEYFR